MAEAADERNTLKAIAKDCGAGLMRRRSGSNDAALARRQNHDHLAAFEARFLLDFGDLCGVDLDPV